MPPKVAPRRQPPPRRNAKAISAGDWPDAPTPKESLDVGNKDAQATVMDAQSSEPRDRLPPESVNPALGSPARPAGSRSGSITGSASGRPVQRLDSLSRRSQSGSSPAPDAPGNKPAGLKFQPKYFIRRSKEEREAQARVEAEKLQARIAANAASSTFGDRGGRGGRGGYQSRGGGSMGRYKNERFGVSQASGVLGGTTRPEDGARKGRFGMRGPWSGTSRSSDFGSSRVKSEQGVKLEMDRDGDVSMGGIGGRRIKTEGGYVSSDEEPDAAAGPRVNIEHINLVSDEDTDEEPISGKGKERAKSARAPGWALKPVRLDRHEHLERAVGVSTEASSLTSAELRKKAQEKDEAEGSLFIPAEEEEPATVKTEKKKPTAKSKDVEFVRNSRKWKGVYRDSDGSDNDGPKIKQEPHAEDVMLIDTPGATTTEATTTTSPNPTSAAAPPPKPEPPTPSKPKPKPPRKQPTPHAPKPILQTNEDRAEWGRHEEDTHILAHELGLPARPAVPNPPPSADADRVGESLEPAAAQGEAEPAAGKDRKDGLVYLFQFPPVVPPLLERGVVAGGGGPAVRTAAAVDDGAGAEAEGEADDAGFEAEVDGAGEGGMMASLEAEALGAGGRGGGGVLGWLVVREDGDCVVSWGGGALAVLDGEGMGREGKGKREGGERVLGMRLGRGGEGEVGQSVVLLDEGGGGDGGRGGGGTEGKWRVGEEAWAVGQLGGGFVVMPDWGRVLGGG